MTSSESSHIDDILSARTKSLFVSENGGTFDDDDNLPDLPVPTLHDTLNSYLNSVRAIATPQQLENTRHLVAEFELGVGQQLQQQLLERAATTKNWLSKWWSEGAYLSQRSPIAPSLRFVGGFTLSRSLWNDSTDAKPFQYMAEYLHWTAQFWWLLRHERLRPHRNRHGVSLSMDQWRHLFSCNRIPQPEIDRIQSLFRTVSEGGTTPTHFVILCNGHIYTNTLVEPHSELPLTVDELRLVLQRVWQLCQSTTAGPNLATLTSDNRTRWAQNREYLCRLSADNCDALETIESAVCHVTLDQHPVSPSDNQINNIGDSNTANNNNNSNYITSCLQRLLCLDPANCWMDKSLTLVAFPGGTGGHSCDHSPFDAMVMVSEGLFCHLAALDVTASGRTVLPPREKLCQPRLVSFQLDDRLRAAVTTAADTASSLLENVCVVARKFCVFGKLWLRANSLHPDAFVQVALQLAYFRLHNRPGPAYETATTRQFWRGRTETVRSCTPQSVAFCRSMLSDAFAPKDRRHLLETAVDAHVQLAARAADGCGCDRHLLALKLLAERTLTRDQLNSSLFADHMWTATGGDGNFVLSTSTTGYSEPNGVTVAMVTDGYGCFYSIEDRWMNINVSAYRNSKSHSPETFYTALYTSLVDMQQLILATKSKL